MVSNIGSNRKKRPEIALMFEVVAGGSIANQRGCACADIGYQCDRAPPLTVTASGRFGFGKRIGCRADVARAKNAIKMARGSFRMDQDRAGI